ncbi:uncharacterized protein LOC128954078 [Oppia nitens]|uniref:uncharacterized protein LOC128954078 n=1 Tax=Oppia nitens TaxID=1686743 RepID=UPI0023DCDF8C|nr:uncharacterized protein LOC128954078 [Oppia nitens]
MPNIYNENISVSKYFWLLAGRQLGVHVFIRDNGNINAILVFVRKQGNKCLIDMFPPTKIQAQYPTIRNERDLNKPKLYIMNRQVFTMGLLFKRFNSNHQNVCWLENNSWDSMGVEILKPVKGWPVEDEYRKFRNNPTDDRCYTRSLDSTRNLSVAGVYDLTEELYRNNCYDDRKNERPKPAAPYCFALYMCAGAKLVVRDSYHKNPAIEKHNQTLVEQGGVIVVEDQLEVSLMVYDLEKSITIKWEDFCNNYMKTNKWIKEKVKKYKNPVLFLGANESDYNTIAWRLMIDKRGFEERSGSN